MCAHLLYDKSIIVWYCASIIRLGAKYLRKNEVNDFLWFFKVFKGFLGLSFYLKDLDGNIKDFIWSFWWDTTFATKFDKIGCCVQIYFWRKAEMGAITFMVKIGLFGAHSSILCNILLIWVTSSTDIVLWASLGLILSLKSSKLSKCNSF